MFDFEEREYKISIVISLVLSCVCFALLIISKDKIDINSKYYVDVNGNSYISDNVEMINNCFFYENENGDLIRFELSEIRYKNNQSDKRKGE